MSRPLGRRRQTNWHIFRWPIAVGTVSLIGLVTALVGDGWYDALSWMLLGGIPVLIGALLARKG